MSIKTDEDDRKNKLTSGKCAKWDEWDEDGEVPIWKTASLPFNLLIAGQLVSREDI